MSEESAWARVDELEEQLQKVVEAHDWQCDCAPDDPCRVRQALGGTCICGHPGLTYDGPLEDCPLHGRGVAGLSAEPHLRGLLRDAERVANLRPGGASGTRLTDGNALQFGGFGAGKGGATDTRNGGRVVLDSAADRDAEQEVGSGGVHVHASRMLDDAEEVKRA